MTNDIEDIKSMLEDSERALRRLSADAGRGPKGLALSAIATQVYLARAALAGSDECGPPALPVGV